MIPRLLLAFVLVSVAGCGGGAERSEEASPPPGTAVREVTLSFPRVVVLPADTSLHVSAIVTDSMEVLTPGITARPLRAREGAWAVDYSWLYLHRSPVRLYTFEEMDSLATVGVIDDETVVGVAVYRVPLEAPSFGELAPLALASKPDRYPDELLELLVGAIDTIEVVFDSVAAPGS